MRKGFLRDEHGATTVGMVVAMLVTLTLVFSGAQVYRVAARAADVQDVADAAALAAQNEVAEFMVAVKVCDAIVLSLNLASLVTTGLGVVCLCTPVTAPMAEPLLESGVKLLKAKSDFATKAASSLNKVQELLPLLSAVNAMRTAAANNGSDHAYLAIAITSPQRGEPIEVASSEAIQEFVDEVKAGKDDVRQKAEEAEELAQEALAAKLEGYNHDCGLNPSYCLYERAGHLSGISGTKNPFYRSVDTWSFSVALKRAQDYYAYRAVSETPASYATLDEQANAALRKLFYVYASEELAKGYVKETDQSFEAYFPSLPTTTQEMRQTRLYSQAAFPVTSSGGALQMHAWSGCPHAAGATSYGSVAQLEASPESYTTCSACGFVPADLGQVAQASARIENGFEYHYLAIARAADDYEKSRQRFDEQANAVKGSVGDWIEKLFELCKEVGSQRITAKPAGSYGCIAVVVDTKALSPALGLNVFASYEGAMGMRAAIAGATMIEEAGDEGQGVIASLVDGLKERFVPGSGAIGLALECWQTLLGAYAFGQDAVLQGVEDALNQLPLVGASGLGTWAASKIRGALESLGLEPANTKALKPVLVNTKYVASADEGAFGSYFLQIKAGAEELGSVSGDVVGSIVSFVEWRAYETLGGDSGTFEVATIAPFGEAGPTFPITIALPQPEGEETGLLGVVGSVLSAAQSRLEGLRQWR